MYIKAEKYNEELNKIYRKEYEDKISYHLKSYKKYIPTERIIDEYISYSVYKNMLYTNQYRMLLRWMNIKITEDKIFLITLQKFEK
jgi:hypothetical protein